MPTGSDRPRRCSFPGPVDPKNGARYRRQVATCDRRVATCNRRLVMWKTFARDARNPRAAGTKGARPELDAVLDADASRRDPVHTPPLAEASRADAGMKRPLTPTHRRATSQALPHAADGRASPVDRLSSTRWARATTMTGIPPSVSRFPLPTTGRRDTREELCDASQRVARCPAGLARWPHGIGRDTRIVARRSRRIDIGSSSIAMWKTDPTPGRRWVARRSRRVGSGSLTVGTARRTVARGECDEARRLDGIVSRATDAARRRDEAPTRCKTIARRERIGARRRARPARGSRIVPRGP
jgi:hypothetical protein